jgi:hypothetical protein
MQNRNQCVTTPWLSKQRNAILAEASAWSRQSQSPRQFNGNTLAKHRARMSPKSHQYHASKQGDGAIRPGVHARVVATQHDSNNDPTPFC